jgi:predicted esterase
MVVSLAVIAYVGRLKQREQALVIDQARVQAERETWARHTAMPAVKQLIEDGRHVHAFRLAKEVQTVLPDDPAFQELWDSFTVTVTFDLEPAGTQVFIRDWDGVNDEWLEVGETPLVDVTLPNGGLRFRYVKEGCIPREFDRPFPDFLEWAGPVSMKEDPGIPEDMVFVDAVQAANWNNLPSDLGDFLIDRYEVSNRQFQEFVGAGGYEQPEFWEQLEFTLEGETLSWREAVKQFHDETGNAGPSGWRNGRLPEGEEDYPVRGVSWFEAVAYARFAGKSLPTIYHWQWAADATAGHVVALSNFSGRGPAPKGAYQGIGRFDVYDLAGNVKEWCWNPDTQGRRCLRGGAWNEASYQCLFVDVASPWDRSETHGFRCVRYLSEGAPPPATIEPWRRKLPHLTGRERLPLKSLEPWYQYDKDQPFNPKIVETGNDSPAEYRHEVVQIDAAYHNERFDVHFFYPREKREKHETILFVPGGGAWLSQRFGPVGLVEWELIPRLVQTGRVVCLPVCKGMFERGDGTFPLPERTLQARDLVIAGAKDLARTIDYLHTRSDLDAGRLVFLGYSSGAMANLPVLSLHPGLRAAILVSGAYPLLPPNTSNEVFYPYHFAPHVKLPVLMINGGLDTLFPYQTLQAPMFEDLGSENKKHVLLESGHNTPNDEVFKSVDEWLLEVFGPP